MVAALVVLAAAAAAAAAATAAATSTVTWDYSRVPGGSGPDTWPLLTFDAPVVNECGGAQQSPVDLSGVEFRRRLPQPLRFATKAMQRTTVSNGRHAARVELRDTHRGAGVRGKTGKASGGPLAGKYALEWLELHSPSEHTVNGRHYVAEAQFVHANDDGHVAAIAMFFVADDDDDDDGALDFVLRAPPLNGVHSVSNVRPIDIVSSTRAFWYYTGSRTSPPCTTGWQWIVLRE
eukprot:CAMPEP_0198310192 /NCGR_PEP_ID=MMETSP1450-20131203/2340_1 /TAXON_ID=753684 ORGANISM="Madagascaria erythrocladiodes, Strain CCMP3234" /NCGR_SAMPLE_ID=MMETSP1450 /ASSEMBLY_ACC=CAM_ASM_001115 /LENGTH=233 /DNA_ID=CAMNT_0044013005 /DNA_START=106 /DNA_END=804 /DNA_ORIENTATION=+